MSSARTLISAPPARRIARARRAASLAAPELEEAPLRTRSYAWRATLGGDDARESAARCLALSVEEDSDASTGAVLFDVAGSALRLVGTSDVGSESRLSFETSRAALKVLCDGLSDILARYGAP